MPTTPKKIAHIVGPYWECDDLPFLQQQKATNLPFVYLIKIEGLPYCKVGSSGNIRSRIGMYQTILPFNLSLAFAVSLPKDGYHIVAEKKTQSILSDKLVRGEWFKCDVDEAVSAIREAVLWTKDNSLEVGNSFLRGVGIKVQECV